MGVEGEIGATGRVELRNSRLGRMDFIKFGTNIAESILFLKCTIFRELSLHAEVN